MCLCFAGSGRNREVGVEVIEGQWVTTSHRGEQLVVMAGGEAGGDREGPEVRGEHAEETEGEGGREGESRQVREGEEGIDRERENSMKKIHHSSE